VELLKLKLVEIDRIDEDLTAHTRFRFEVWGIDQEGRHVQELGNLTGTWKVHLGTRMLSSFELVDAHDTTGPGDLFVDVATERGVDFMGDPDSRFLPPSSELKFQTSRHSVGGVAASDFTGDGADDLMLLGGEDSRLYENDGSGRFTDVTSAWGLGDIQHGNVATFADYDNDGDQDLFVGFFYGQNRLYRNDGDQFVDVTADSGLAQDDMVAVAAAIDVNGDGNLDLYLGRFLNSKAVVPDMIHYTRNGEPNQLYLGDGELGFRNVTADAGDAGDVGLTLGIAAADYDQDGDQDIYLANDFGRNVLLRNRGDGVFDDIAKEANALAISGGMSATFGDVDGDGWLDLYVSSIRSNQRWYSQDINIRGYVLALVDKADKNESLQRTFLDLRETLGEDWDQVGQHELSGNYLLRNNQNGHFEDQSDPSGTRLNGWYWGTAFVDLDNDGHQDLVAANGWITGDKEHDL
jgi:hypothetical protein